MGMDGLSFSNTGIKESTSAEFANKTEHAVQSNAIQDSEQVQNLSVNERVRRKDEEEQNDSKKKQQAKEEFEDGLVEENPDDNPDALETEIEYFDNLNKDFYVKLNAKDDIIELYDSTTNRLIETISGNELGELVQKLNMASGIFVNKKV